MMRSWRSQRIEKHPRAHGCAGRRRLLPFRSVHMDVPDWLPAPENQTSGKGVDLRKVLMEDFRFSAAAEPGLEMADIVVNAVRRALTGNLSFPGWREIPQL